MAKTGALTMTTIGLLLTMACASPEGEAPADTAETPSAETPRDAHTAGVLAWREDRRSRLLEPDGWLSLVGLAWLEPGSNSVGSAEGSQVPLPASVPAQLGEMTLEDGRVRLSIADGVEVATADGPVVGTVDLATDANGAPTEILAGTVRFFVIERQGGFAVRIKDSEAPTLVDFAGLDYFDVDPSWQLDARFEAYDPPKTVQVPSVLGGANAIDSPGAVVFEVGGQTHRIDALPGGADGSLFLVFGDTTNGTETYGGGRFLYTDPPAEDGTVVVDFNLSYSPPCIFTPYATCPLPTPENKLAVAIRAGEKTYSAAAH